MDKIKEVGSEFVNELTILKDGNVQWLLDPKTYRQVSGMYAIGVASICIAGACLGGYIAKRIVESREEVKEVSE